MSLLLVGFLLAAPPDRPTRCVVADVANVRRDPNDKGALVGRLRIGTEAQPVAKKGGWTRVPFPTWTKPLEGYSRSDFLAPACVSLMQAELRKWVPTAAVAA